MLLRLLIGLVDQSRRHALLFVLGAVLVGAFSAWFASRNLGVTTDTDAMFSPAVALAATGGGDEQGLPAVP